MFSCSHRCSFRVFILFLLAVTAFQVVAWFSNIYAKLAGVVLASIACGGGEITFLAMSSYYHKNTISAWSSGTGGAGIVGSLSYLILKGWIGLTPRWVLIICTPLNLLLILSSYLLMTGKHALGGFCARGRGKVTELSDEHVPLTTRERLRQVIPLCKYMIPLLVVYFAEYLINQAIFPNLKFRLGLIHPDDNYVYYQFTYQVGVFVSRSSVSKSSLFHFHLYMIRFLPH
jgi:battenin